MASIEHELFPSTLGSTRTHEGVVILAPGWLGSRVLSTKVAPHLSQKGFDTVVVGHDRHTYTGDPDRARSVNIHRAAQLALTETRQKKLHLVGYSKGSADVVNFMTWNMGREEDAQHDIHGFGAVAPIGLNGHELTLDGIVAEYSAQFVRTMSSLRGRDAGLFWRSLGNFISNPGLAAQEGLTTLTRDARQEVETLRVHKAFATEYETYGDNDRLVRPPLERPVPLYSGHHATPVTEPDVIMYTVGQIAA